MSNIDDERREAHEVEHLLVVRAGSGDKDVVPAFLAAIATVISTEIPEVLMYWVCGRLNNTVDGTVVTATWYAP